MPAAELVEQYARRGCTLVIMGSDFPVPATGGAGFVRTFTMLELAGIREFSRFRNRVRQQVAIADLRP
jgi:hypothetical protein